MNTKIIKLDINKNLYDILVAKQGDTKSRFLLFNLLDGSIPFSLENRSVRVYAIKPDGTEVFNDLIITDAAKGYCILELTTQMLAVAGTVKLELMVMEGDKKLTSNIFYMDVKKSINSEKAVVSTNEFGALLTALSSLNEYDNYKKEIAAARDGEANLLTKVKKIDEQLEHIVSDSYKKSLLSKNVQKINIIGDSITHGANAPNIDKQSWAGILKERLLNIYDSNNYGFMKSVNLLSNSLGNYTLPMPTIYEPQYSWDINYQADNYIGQMIWYSTTKDSKITFKPQLSFKRFKIHYGQLSNGGIIHIYANNQFLGEINTLGENNTCKISQEFDIARLQHPIEIEILKQDGGYTAISGFDFYNDINDITINNYARSGNSLTGIDNKVLDYECNCDVSFFCLGHNDVNRDISVFKNKIDRVISNYKTNNTFVVVCDFIWSKDKENLFRKELMRLATETNGMYICMDNVWGNDVNKLVSDGLLSDTSHPAPLGHKLIVDTICNQLGIQILDTNLKKYYEINLIKNSYFNLGIDTNWTFETDDSNISIGSNLNNNNAWIKGEVTPFINFSNIGEKNVNVKYYQEDIKVEALKKYKLMFSHISWGGVCKVRISDNDNNILLEEYLETINRPLATTNDGYWNNLELYFKTKEKTSTIKIEFIVEKTYNTTNGYLFLYGVKILGEGINDTNDCIVKSNAPIVKPHYVGQIYIDKLNNKVYMSKDVQDVSDWILLN